MFSRFSKGLVTIIALSLLMTVVVLPDSVKQNWPNNRFVNLFKDPKVTLGLDLQGGTQLDYRIDLRNARAKNEDDDLNNDVRINDVIEGVRATIDRRVNSLGVSEPNIYLSKVADEDHIIVELAGIKDVDEAKATVGKTIQLEFKEQKDALDIDERDVIEANAKSILENATAADADFDALGKSTETSDGKIGYRPEAKRWKSELPDHYKEVLPRLAIDKVHPATLEGSDGYALGAGGSITEKKGLYIVQMKSKEVNDRTEKKFSTLKDVASALNTEVGTQTDKTRADFDPAEVEAVFLMAETGQSHTDVLEIGEEYRVYGFNGKGEAERQVEASHILISYTGSERTSESVTRTKEEALELSKQVLEEAEAEPGQFPDLARKYSDGPSGPTGGELGFFGKGKMTQAFEEASLAMAVGDISDVVETEFGYHIINVTDEKTLEDRVNVSALKVEKTEANKAKLDEEILKMDGYDVTTQEEELVYNELFFDLTPDPWKPTGLDGAHFKYASPTYNDIGIPQVNIEFDSEGGKMFEEITERLVGKPLAIFVGGQLISAPNVNQKISGGTAVITGQYTPQEAMQLARDLNTGAIDAPIILSGQYTISATLGETALRVSLLAGLIGLILLALYMIAYYRLMGIFAVLALLIYSIIIVFILKTTGIVMTLAGIAGIILSIGMAVDANILIFERTKEELNSGKNFSASVSAGFERAWSSIRDSNVSSLITCVILYSFGNSIIRGFALMLAIGILISMLTAITVTKKFLQTLTGTRLAKNRFLLGVKKIETINR